MIFISATYLLTSTLRSMNENSEVTLRCHWDAIPLSKPQTSPYTLLMCPSPATANSTLIIRSISGLIDLANHKDTEEQLEELELLYEWNEEIESALNDCERGSDSENTRNPSDFTIRMKKHGTTMCKMTEMFISGKRTFFHPDLIIIYR